MTALVTKATPALSITKLRVGEELWSRWPETLRSIRTCQHCGVVYKHAGAAWVCEHHHEGL